MGEPRANPRVGRPAHPTDSLCPESARRNTLTEGGCRRPEVQVFTATSTPPPAWVIGMDIIRPGLPSSIPDSPGCHIHTGTAEPNGCGGTYAAYQRSKSKARISGAGGGLRIKNREPAKAEPTTAPIKCHKLNPQPMPRDRNLEWAPAHCVGADTPRSKPHCVMPAHFR